MLYLFSAWFVAGAACWTAFVALGLRFEAREEAVAVVGLEGMVA